MKRITLKNSTAERLDTALAVTLKISRAQAQQAIKDGLVGVAEKKVNAHLIVAPGTEVTLEKAAKIIPKSVDNLAPLDIIFENEDAIVVNKPAGLLVHQAPNSNDATLADVLLKYAPQIKDVGDDKKRAGIVHRLDKEASGVLIVAKNDAAYKHLKNQFKNRQTEKFYTVFVMGDVKDEYGTINFPLARSSSKARMAARPLGDEGKEAVTHYTVLEHYTVGTLLNVQIETGRTHQIRAHFFALGFPVAGDTLYARKDIKAIPELKRLFLHARSLTITLPNGERKTFEAPLPQELTDTLARLKHK